MVRQENYQEDVSDFELGEPVKRVVIKNLYHSEKLFTKFSEDTDDDFLELNFFDMGSGALLDSVILLASENVEEGWIYQRIIPARSDEEELVINTRKLIDDGFLNLAPGYYDVTINIFSHEVGRVYARPLNIVALSNSRTELALEYEQDFEGESLTAAQEEIREFVEPSIRIIDLIPLVKQTFSDAETETTTEPERLTVSDILSLWEARGDGHYEQAMETSLYTNESIIIREETDNFIKSGNLNDKLPCIYFFLYQDLLDALGRGDRRIQISEMRSFIKKSIQKSFDEHKSRFPATIGVS